ncbi:MAG: thioesterase domain-containing protein, partial [Cyanobacteria bacterium J06636_27]
CPITALGGLEDTEATREELAAWSSRTNHNFTLHMLPGNHFFINSARSQLLQLVYFECNQGGS